MAKRSTWRQECVQKCSKHVRVHQQLKGAQRSSKTRPGVSGLTDKEYRDSLLWGTSFYPQSFRCQATLRPERTSHCLHIPRILPLQCLLPNQHPWNILHAWSDFWTSYVQQFVALCYSCFSCSESMVRLNSKVSTSRTEAGRAGEQCQYPNRDRNEEHKERHLTKFSKLKVTSKTENSRNSKPLRLTLQVQFEECGRLWKHSLAKHSTRINENQRGQLCFRIGLQCQWRRCLEIGLKKARNSKDRRENMAKHGYYLGVQTTISNPSFVQLKDSKIIQV